MSSTLRFSIVIPQHGCWEQTIHCCSTLLRQHREPMEIVVVDDGSPAQELALTRQWLPEEVRLIEQTHQGITSAWNRGLAETSAPGVVLLNNDTSSQKPWLFQLDKLLTEDPQRLVGATRHSWKRQLRLERTIGIPGRPQRLLAGWCLGFMRTAADQIGRFDESMKLYWSDTDWQYRWLNQYGDHCEVLKTLAGNPILHQGHVSTRRLTNRQEQWRQDRQYFWQKWTHSVTKLSDCGSHRETEVAKET